MPGLISYESVRYQIGHFYCSYPDVVRELLDLVEKEKVFFHTRRKCDYRLGTHDPAYL
jgi:hypothetical protein